MLNLMKCHYNYLLSKTVIVIMVIALFAITVNCSVLIATTDSAVGYKEISEVYSRESFLVIKIFYILLISFMSVNSYLPQQENYYNMLFQIGKAKYYASKMLTLIALSFEFIVVVFAISVVIGKIGYLNISFSTATIISYLQLFLIGIYYMMLSSLLAYIFKNIYTVIAIFMFFILGAEYKDDFSLYNFFFPNVDNINGSLINGFGSLILSIAIISVINISVYLKKDMF